MPVKQAVCLVGGRGTRLGALTADTPKPLLPIAEDLRFIDIVIDAIARHGISDIVLIAGFRAEQVERAYDGGRVRGARVRVVTELEPSGTGAALLAARDVLEPWFLLVNGDSYFDIDLGALIASPPVGRLGRLALREVPDVARYGHVELGADGVVSAFREKPVGRQGPGLVSAGVYLLNREILELLDVPSSLERDAFGRLTGTGLLEGAIFDGYFIDIGLPETYSKAIADLTARRAVVARAGGGASVR